MAARPIPMLLAMALLATGACRHDRRARLTVFAAASLAAPFEQLAREFERTRADVAVDLHCAGTPRLVLQLSQGAPADVFASADGVQMQRAVELGVVTGEPMPFAANRMAIVTQRDNPKRIRELADLARDDVAVLLCAPDVPAGRYARLCLQRAGVEVGSRSDEPNVRAVVGKVRLGVVDAAIVYASDAHGAGDDLHHVEIPSQHNVTAVYPIACLDLGGQPALAAAFVAFTRGAAGTAVLSSHGFSEP